MADRGQVIDRRPARPLVVDAEYPSVPVRDFTTIRDELDLSINACPALAAG